MLIYMTLSQNAKKQLENERKKYNRLEKKEKIRISNMQLENEKKIYEFKTEKETILNTIDELKKKYDENRSHIFNFAKKSRRDKLKEEINKKQKQLINTETNLQKLNKQIEINDIINTKANTKANTKKKSSSGSSSTKKSRKRKNVSFKNDPVNEIQYYQKNEPVSKIKKHKKTRKKTNNQKTNNL